MLTPAVPLLIALLLAFAGDAIVPMVPSSTGDLASSLMEAAVGLMLAAGVAMGLGLGLTAAVRSRGLPSSSARRGFLAATYVVQAMNLAVYAWLIHGLGWPELIRGGLGLRDGFVVDEFLILLPFLVAEIIGWWGLYPAARASRLAGRVSSVRPYLIRKARLTFGMILPSLILFWAGNDLARRIFGSWSGSPAVQFGVMATMGGLLMLVSPAFVRLTWPSQPLPPGPLRDRLDGLATRFGFRYTDILLWDTDGMVFNAVLTGISPRFRYILLSDALVAHLHENEVAAVFGHEMGHIHHRHLAFFGLFFLGSLGVLALVSQGVDAAFSVLPWGLDWGTAVEVAKSTLVLGTIGLYYWIVFGALSRRFERQADVFGCRAVSCGGETCPPHAEGHPVAASSDALCPVGIRICVETLEVVASENGVRADAPSWRHGSIANRVGFLLDLEDQPGAERDFQRGVGRLRGLLTLLLATAVVLAWLSGAFETLRGL